jgi:hypothetical protein
MHIESNKNEALSSHVEYRNKVKAMGKLSCKALDETHVGKR